MLPRLQTTAARGTANSIWPSTTANVTGVSRLSETFVPAGSGAAACAFLCDDDGRVICDLSLPPGSGEFLPGRTLVGQMPDGSWAEFLALVRNGIEPFNSETLILAEGGGVSRLLLHGSRTPWGIFVLGTRTPCPGTRGAERPQSSSAGRRGPDEIGVQVFKAIHDFGNPISAIIGSCEYLAEYSSENLNAQQRQMIGSIESSARELFRLSSKIADLTRLQWPSP